MLSEIKETNKKLREKLHDFKSESLKPSSKKDCYLAPPTMLDASTGPIRTTSRRVGCSDCLPPPCCNSRPTLLSDRAKYIRGEATKRIDNLFHDWKDFKDRTDEELRKRLRSEQHMKELLARKDREMTEMSRELCCLRNTLKEQKKIIEHLNHELNTEEKCRNRCSELELQIGKLNRHIGELNDELEVESKCRNRCAELEAQIGKLNRHVAELNQEIRARDDLIRSSEAEKESLSGVNAELRERNTDQKRKIEMCEHDVNETRMELEILDEMVRALNDRKLNIFAAARGHLDRSLTPGMERGPNTYPPPLQRHSRPTTPSGYYAPVPENAPHQVTIATDEDRDRRIAERLSAMSQLKNLKKEHIEKCDNLAERIQTLKDENAMKETTISELKKSARL